MRVGCCVNPRAWGDDMAKYLCDIKDCGFDYIELPVTRVVALDEAGFDALLDGLSDAPVKCECLNLLFPPDMKVIGPDTDDAAICAHLSLAFERMSRLGAEIVVFGSGRTRRIPEGFSHERAEEQFLSLLQTLEDYAAKYGITVVLEHLNSNECNFITTVRQGYDLIKKVGLPHIKMLIDYYHMKVENEDESIIDQMDADILRHMHFADPDGRTFPVPHKAEEYKKFFSRIRKIGYDQRLSMETSSKNILEDATKTLPFFKEIL